MHNTFAEYQTLWITRDEDYCLFTKRASEGLSPHTQPENHLALELDENNMHRTIQHGNPSGCMRCVYWILVTCSKLHYWRAPHERSQLAIFPSILCTMFIVANKRCSDFQLLGSRYRVATTVSNLTFKNLRPVLCTDFTHT
jgi:hypothetical protein